MSIRGKLGELRSDRTSLRTSHPGPALIAHSLRRIRTLVLAMGLLLAGFQVLLTLVAGSIQRSGSFAQVAALAPPFVRQLLGDSFLGMMSFAGILCFGYFHPIVMASLVGLAISLGTEPVSEIETRFVDLILSRPLARHWIITRSIVLLAGSIVVVLAMMTVGTWAGLTLLAPEGAEGPRPWLIGSLAINLAVLMLCWGGVATGIGALSRRRGAAGATVGLIALAAYLLDYVARVWAPARSAALLSPFHYYTPLDLVMGKELPARHLGVLLGIAVASFVLAYAVYTRRDL